MAKRLWIMSGTEIVVAAAIPLPDHRGGLAVGAGTAVGAAAPMMAMITWVLTFLHPRRVCFPHSLSTGQQPSPHRSRGSIAVRRFTPQLDVAAEAHTHNH